MNPLRLQLPHARRVARRYLRPGDTVLDIGAANGEYTMTYAAAVGPTGSVVAFEPHPHTRAAGQLACASYPWVTWHDRAVGAVTADRVRFFGDRGDPKRSSLCSANVSVQNGTYRVDLTTVDAIVAGLPRVPRLIQVDTQGYEAAVLRGARRTLALRTCLWILEIWPVGLTQAGATVGDVVRTCRDAGCIPRDFKSRLVPWADVLRRAATCRDHQHFDLLLVPDDCEEANLT